ncbi:hypothetical protein SASPL_136975 [Salvia splendens]|uniref:Uncharacterized protein n=1 Tax=Salvia splendens TaxID=180675 RepID=A0A8X8X1P9_SALSN|nr:hypothetical protein SASPL_136975 [Salvia splendens]
MYWKCPPYSGCFYSIAIPDLSLFNHSFGNTYNLPPPPLTTLPSSTAAGPISGKFEYQNSSITVSGDIDLDLGSIHVARDLSLPVNGVVNALDCELEPFISCDGHQDDQIGKDFVQFEGRDVDVEDTDVEVVDDALEHDGEGEVAEAEEGRVAGAAVGAETLGRTCELLLVAGSLFRADNSGAYDAMRGTASAGAATVVAVARYAKAVT